MFKIRYNGNGKLNIGNQVIKAIEKGELEVPPEDEWEEINCHEHGEIMDMFNTLINDTYFSEKNKDRAFKLIAELFNIMDEDREGKLKFYEP
jgi:hypothetical protein